MWRVELAVLGQSLSLPIFVDLGSAGSGSGAAVLRFCPIWQAQGGPRPLITAYLTIQIADAFALPAVPGRYTWSALLEPALLGSLTPDPSRTFELRSLVPHPHTMTLTARHDQKTKSVVLSGKVTAVGSPEPGVEVSFFASLASSDEFTSFGPVTTNASGEFSVRRRIEQTTRFSAAADGQTRACSSPSTAPAGCLVETVSPPPGASVIVGVRGALDSKLEPRPREQALARRINLKLGDLPAGWQAFPYPNPFFPCPGFKPNLSKLTVQGEAESPVFVTEQAAAAWSKTSIYASEPQARTAFEREARLAAARCVAAEATREGATVRSVASASFPRLGGQTRAFRIVLSDPQESGYLDLVSIRQGRAVIHLGFAATNELAIERSLARKVAARARAA